MTVQCWQGEVIQPLLDRQIPHIVLAAGCHFQLTSALVPSSDLLLETEQGGEMATLSLLATSEESGEPPCIFHLRLVIAGDSQLCGFCCSFQFTQTSEYVGEGYL